MVRFLLLLTPVSRSGKKRKDISGLAIWSTLLAGMLCTASGCIEQWQEDTKKIGDQMREQRRSTEAARQRGETGKLNDRIDKYTVVMVGWSRFELEDAVGKPTRVVAGGSSDYPDAKRFIYEGTDGSVLGVLFDNVVLDVDYPSGHGVTPSAPEPVERAAAAAAPVEVKPPISDPKEALPGLYALKIAVQWKDVGGEVAEHEFAGDQPVLASEFQEPHWHISVPGETWFGTTEQLPDIELVVDAGSLPGELLRFSGGGTSDALRLVVRVKRGSFALDIDGLPKYAPASKATSGTVKIDRRTWTSVPKGSSLWDILGYAQDGTIRVPAEAQLTLLNANDDGALIGYEIPATSARAGVSQISIELTTAKATGSDPQPQKELLEFVRETVSGELPVAIAQLVPASTAADGVLQRVDAMLSNTTARSTDQGWQIVGWANAANRNYHYQCDVQVDDGAFRWSNLAVLAPSSHARTRLAWPVEARRTAVEAVAALLALPAAADVHWRGTLTTQSPDGRKVFGEAEYDGQKHVWSCTIDSDTNGQLRATKVDLDGKQTWLTGVLSIDSQLRPLISRSSFMTWQTITLEEIRRGSSEATEQQLEALRRVDQNYLRQGHYHLFEIPNRGEMIVTWTGNTLRHSNAQLGVWTGDKFEYQKFGGGDKDYSPRRMIERPTTEPLVYFVVAAVAGEQHLRTDSISVEYLGDAALAAAGADDAFRSWTAKSGQHVKAKYLSVVRGKVKLELENGKSTYVDLTSLSDADQRFVELRTGRGKAPQGNANKGAAATSPDTPSAETEAGKEDQGFRVWKATNGRTVTAKLLNVIGGKVKLQPEEGKAFYFDLKLLGEDDQKYVEEQTSRNRRR